MLAAIGIWQHDAVLPAVFRHIRDAEGDGGGGRSDPDGLPVAQDFSRVGGRQSEDGFGELRAPRADQSGDADDFAAPHRQRDVVDPGVAARHLSQFEGDVSGVAAARALSGVVTAR